MDKLFQTRSEETGLGNYATLREALQAAEQDESIIKVSFGVGRERVILDKSLGGEWVLRTDPLFI